MLSVALLIPGDLLRKVHVQLLIDFVRIDNVRESNLVFTIFRAKSVFCFTVCITIYSDVRMTNDFLLERGENSTI